MADRALITIRSALVRHAPRSRACGPNLGRIPCPACGYISALSIAGQPKRRLRHPPTRSACAARRFGWSPARVPGQGHRGRGASRRPRRAASAVVSLTARGQRRIYTSSADQLSLPQTPPEPATGHLPSPGGRAFPSSGEAGCGLPSVEDLNNGTGRLLTRPHRGTWACQHDHYLRRRGSADHQPADSAVTGWASPRRHPPL